MCNIDHKGSRIAGRLNAYLQECRSHFLLADRFKTQATDLAWLLQYFLGKVAEKQAPPSIAAVMEHYWQCAEFMREDAYNFPLKIKLNDQTHFEPIELFYRVTCFLQKRLFAAYTNASAAEMHRVVLCLRHFSGYGVSRRHSPHAPSFRSPSRQLLTAHDAQLAAANAQLENPIEQTVSKDARLRRLVASEKRAIFRSPICAI